MANVIARLRQWLWPFDRMQLVEHLPEHLRENARMRNRWKLGQLRPYILRWLVVVGMLGLSLDIVQRMDGGMAVVLHLVLFTAWGACVAFTGLLAFLYTKRLQP